MSVAETKVTGIIKALSELEDDLDSLTARVSEMKKQINIKTQVEINSLMQKTRELATSEAESIINTSRQKAKAESEKILKSGDAKLAEIQSKIDTGFNDAVKHVVSTVLKV